MIEEIERNNLINKSFVVLNEIPTDKLYTLILAKNRFSSYCDDSNQNLITEIELFSFIEKIFCNCELLKLFVNGKLPKEYIKYRTAIKLNDLLQFSDERNILYSFRVINCTDNLIVDSNMNIHFQ